MGMEGDFGGRRFVKTVTLEHTKAAVVMKALDPRTAGMDVKALAARLHVDGYSPSTAAKGVLGYKERLTSNDGKVVDAEIKVQDYEKRGSKDHAALVEVTVSAEKKKEVYRMYLVAPGGNFNKAVEYTVKEGQVVKAHSWWTRTRACLRSRCIAACISSLFTCTGTWAAYLWCVIGICGGCFTRCSLCAGCNCSWWCKWAVGCCRD